MLSIHPNARTTPAVRAEIARSTERSGVLAERYGVSTETVREWRRRGPAECRDRSSSAAQATASSKAAMAHPPWLLRIPLKPRL